MKYAFSTISWTSFTWKEAIAMAKDLGFSGNRSKRSGE